MTSPFVLMKKWQYHPKKQMGQNFLSDPSTAEMLIHRSGIEKDDIVLEIGPGFGALTIPIAKAAKYAYAVEKDGQIIPILEEELLLHNIRNVTILKKNILNLDIPMLLHEYHQPLIIMGNLPYNISSQVLVKLINARESIKRAYLMFQKELAMRIAAPPGSKDYGRISVMLGYCADIRSIAQVKAHLFAPKPKVDSEILEIRFKHKPEYKAENESLFFNVIKAGFGKRRKTLKNALSKSDLNMDATKIHAILEEAGIDPVRRAETLTVKEFVILSNAFNRYLVENQKG